MTGVKADSIALVRDAVADFQIASKVDPNEKIALDRVFTPDSHRSVLDIGRQLVVGNRGMGKSFWTHALTDPDVRKEVSIVYRQPLLARTKPVIGFNGSDRTSTVAPTREAIARVMAGGNSPEKIWKAVIFRAIRQIVSKPESSRLDDTIKKLESQPFLFEEALTETDDTLAEGNEYVLIIFDALDRLADDWQSIRALTTGLFRQTLGLKSFRSLKTKIFIRPDQYADQSIFQFPDGSKLKNEHVDLSWQPHELFGLLFFEICRTDLPKRALLKIADQLGAQAALSPSGLRSLSAHNEQVRLVNALAGPYMGSDARRGKVYTWVPLHLSDARNACSPRTFLTAWQKAAEHGPAPRLLAVDHLGLIEGVRRASSARLEELREDYRWIDDALGALSGQFVPIEKTELLDLWQSSQVVQRIMREAKARKWLAPVELEAGANHPGALLEAMTSIAVMEERANGKINVPDIFRVEAGIKRKGGVAVPRKT